MGSKQFSALSEESILEYVSSKGTKDEEVSESVNSITDLWLLANVYKGIEYESNNQNSSNDGDSAMELSHGDGSNSSRGGDWAW